MSTVAERLEEVLNEEEILLAIDSAQSQEERDALLKIAEDYADNALARAVGDFRRASGKFLELIDDLTKTLERITRGPGEAPALQKLMDEIAEIHREFHDSEGMRSAHESEAEVQEVIQDEESEPATVEPVPVEPPKPADPEVSAPTPVNSKTYSDLSDEYVRFFKGAKIKSARKSIVKKFAAQAISNRARYESVGNKLGIPWWFIAGIHLLESSYNMTTHLHNGDPLSGKTFRVPAGRPKSGSPPFKWETSAVDALKMQGLDGLGDWSLPRALYRWEKYNGFGYRKKGVPTPYLWSFSSVYDKGKFVADGVFDVNKVSKQCGAAVLLRHLFDTGVVSLFQDEGEAPLNDTFRDEAAAVDGDDTDTDDDTAPLTDFEKFFKKKLPGIRHFKAHEFLVKGGSHATNGLNTDPPKELWPNVIELAKVLDEFRERVGHPIVLTSAYRSPAYNQAIGGAKASQHKEFRAVDFVVKGSGTGPRDWAAILDKMRREENFFKGGLHAYNSFVHVDTRGWNANW